MALKKQLSKTFKKQLSETVLKTNHVAPAATVGRRHSGGRPSLVDLADKTARRLNSVAGVDPVNMIQMLERQEEEKTYRFVLHPSSKRKRYWDVFTALFVIYLSRNGVVTA